MTYLLTCKQIDSGVGDIAETLTNINVEDFAKKSEVATKEELNTLSGVVANKLDSSPIHHHDIADIDQLATVLGDKLDRTQRYNYSSLISDPEKIDYLDALKTPSITLSPCKQLSLYSFELDANNNDLKILYVGSNPSITIASYNLSSGNWVFGSYNIGEVLQNHHDAIELLSNNQTVPGSSSLTVSETALTSSKKIVAPSFETSGTISCVGPIYVSRNASNESTQQYILNGRITGNDFATISFGRNDDPNGCGVLRYNYPNKFVSMGFWFNNELFKLDTNGNVNITGSISSPTITDILNRLEFVESVCRWLVQGEGQPPVFPNSS